MPTSSKIGKLASEATRKEFAAELSSYTQLTQAEIQVLFPTKADREALAKLISIVNSSKDENTKRKELAESIKTLSGAVLKVAQKFAVGLG